MTVETNTTKKEQNKPRPPVVVVMGHIDHGKTTLLDTIRKSRVAEKESGGITQHIGAYEVEIQSKEGRSGKITFIDTPGHEAFSQMRSRGASVADIAVLVVAADDGIKPQTEEALHTIQKAGIPFIIAINKIDKPSADPEKVKKEFAEKNVLVEGWGGKVPVVALSAKTGEGIPDLLEMILLVAELENFESDAAAPATGVIIESRLDARRGNTATILVRNGTLRQGEYVVAGETFSPVRIFEDFQGNPTKEAFPSQPVRIVGFSASPPVGIIFETVGTKVEAEKKIEEYKNLGGSMLSPNIETPTEEEEQKAKEMHIIPLVLKADTAGSLEVMETEIKKFEKEKLILKIVKKSVGPINEDDIKVASSSEHAAVVGFHVKTEREARVLAERFRIPIKVFDIIYELIDWVGGHIEETTPTEQVEEVMGRAQILKIFSKKGSKQIVGARVLSGVIKNKAKVKVLRREQMLAHARILELQKGKAEAQEIEEGNEFGVRIDSSIEIAPKDVIEVVEQKTLKKVL